MKNADEVLAYHQQSKFLFRTQFEKTLQAPFYLTATQMKSLEASVSHMYRFLKRTYKPKDIFLARPEFIQVGNDFKLIDLNVSSSITSFSYSACLRYLQNHPNSILSLDLKQVATLDFDSHLSEELKIICRLKKAKTLLILQEPFEHHEPHCPEAIANASKLQSHGLSVKLVNPRYAKFRFHKDAITCNGVKYKAVLVGFLAKYVTEEAWLLEIIDQIRTSGVLVGDFETESSMMSKRNLLLLSKSSKRHSLPTVSLTDYRHLPPLKRRQKNWVLKHVDGNNSEQVVVGAEVSKEEWVHALAVRAERDWILQRYQSPARRVVPVISNGKVHDQSFYPVFSPFVINGKIRGVLVKAYTKDVNGHLELFPGLAILKS